MPESPSDLTEHTTRHTIDIDAPAEEVFAVIADAESWPVVFPPTVHVRRKAEPDGAELLDIWASAAGNVKAWRSRRELDHDHLTASFTQIVSSAPVASMSGTWRVTTNDAGLATVTLDHRFTAVADNADSAAWIERAIEANSTAELAALAQTVSGKRSGAYVSLEFSDTLAIDSAAQPVFDFLHQAQLWPQRLSHVARVDLTKQDNAQVLEMDTVSNTGDAHTTRSFRVVADRFELAYKQTVVPDGFLAHYGKWSLEETADATLATSYHRVHLNLTTLGPRLGVTERHQIEQRVRDALGGNSLRTLHAAKVFVESDHSVAAASRVSS
ncbi:SRPBCC family protein [Rhodococcus jostii]|uniref:SRPBCC family protein n=1 Tax=Rhodococcus jostii TaxID=132919 RepID=A0ABU4CTK0_RHOJO|nr:SRPBCC family protein [Rhodococcus jostii]MDV6286803.1 SRPBCC family protein [Rhodococcus jostii]